MTKRRIAPMSGARRLIAAGMLVCSLVCPAKAVPAVIGLEDAELAQEPSPPPSPRDAEAAVPTAEWNRLSPEQLARHYELEMVAPGVWRLRLGQPEKLTPLSFRVATDRTPQMEALPACPRLPLKASSIGFKTTGRSVVVELPLQTGERIYGLGMQLGLFDPLQRAQ